MQRNADVALADFDAALAIDDQYGNAYLGRAKAYRYQGNEAKAADDEAKAQSLGTAKI
jgi:Tfp pilus assembly protein PilF